MKKKAPKYVLFISMAEMHDDRTATVLFRMLGQVPRARTDGKFRSPAQLVDHFRIVQATGGKMELSIQIHNLEDLLQQETPREPWQG